MFIIPSKYTKKSPIFDCIDRIKKFHPNEKILIIDSNSVDKSYFLKIKEIDNVEVYDANNINYEIGSLWYVYENKLNKNDENFYLIQDGILLNRNVDIMKDFEFCAFAYNEKHDGECLKYFDENFNNKSDYQILTDYFMVFGTCFFAKKTFLDKLNKKKVISILPTYKLGSECWERFIGNIAKQENINLVENSLIHQNKLSENGVYFLENGCEVYSNNFFDKVFCGRK